MKCPKCENNITKNDYDYLWYCNVCNKEFSDCEVIDNG